MTEKKKKWFVDEDDELRLFYGDEEFNGSAYPCNDVVFMKMIADKLNKLEKENKQLKSDNNRLVNETAKIIAEHQGRVFDLIDEKIDELEKQYKFGQEIYKGCPMHNIRYGINTLKELKKELQND